MTYDITTTSERLTVSSNNTVPLVITATDAVTFD